MWGSQTYDLQPDMVTCAKGLSAAMLPISAILISERVFNVMKDESNRNGAFVHGFTYAGHPVASSVAIEVIKIYEELDIVARVKSLEATFLNELRSLMDHPLVGDASGVGLIGGIEIVKNKETRESYGAEIGVGQKSTTMPASAGSSSGRLAIECLTHHRSSSAMTKFWRSAVLPALHSTIPSARSGRFKSPQLKGSVLDERYDRAGQGASAVGMVAVKRDQILFTYLHLAPEGSKANPSGSKSQTVG